MKKLLLIGEMYSENLGDGIICETVNNLFKEQYDVKILDLSGRKKYIPSNNTFNFFKENIQYLKSILKKVIYRIGFKGNGKKSQKIYNEFIKNFDKLAKDTCFDTIIFVGGQLFIDVFINQIQYVCQYAKENNKKVVFNSCGTGKLLQVNKLKSILNNESVKYISVRDGRNKIEKYTTTKIFDCHDNAILCNKYYKLVSNKRDNLGIGIMFSTLQSPCRQVAFWKKLLKSLKKNNINFKIFTNGSTKDQSFAEYLLRKCKISAEEHLISKPKKPEELVSTINTFTGICSMRLHSMIVAYSLNIPCVPISWDEKVNVFFQKIDYSINCFNLKSKIADIILEIKKLKDIQYNTDLKEKIETEININIKNINNVIENLEERYETKKFEN